MNQQELRQKILLATFNSLIGNISINMRLISIGWTTNSYHMKVFFKDQPKDSDIELVEEMTTLICADLLFIENCKEDYFVWDSIRSVDLLQETVFMTREHLIMSKNDNEVGVG